jgi:hypothetical protein
VRLLLDRCQADRSKPNVTALAAVRGHVDVLRLLLEKWPEGDRGEALAFAVMLGHGACASLLLGACFRWTRRVVRILRSLPNATLRDLAYWFARSHGVAGQDSQSEVSLWEGVRAMVEDESTPVAAVKILAHWVEREPISVPEAGAEFWAMMREAAGIPPDSGLD